jgi:hypothetical protein
MNPYKVIAKEHGYPLDHIGLAVHDLDLGVRYVQDLMGVEPRVHPPDAANAYQNATFRISNDSFFEVIAPNNNYRGFHPFKSVLKSFIEPTLFFWLVAVDDFDSFRREAKGFGVKMENVVEVKEVDTSLFSAHIRGQMGPGFFSLRPSVIEWRSEIVELNGPVQCSLKRFRLYDPGSEALNQLFENLGINIKVENGDSKMLIELETPKGIVTLESAAYQLGLLKMLSLSLRDLLRLNS